MTEDTDTVLRELQQQVEIHPTYYCLFDGTVTGTSVPLVGFGIHRVTRVNTGIYTVTFENLLFNERYIVLVTPSQERVCWVDSKTKGSFQITTEDNASAAADTSQLNVVIIAA
jgi:hypothetical protein